MKYLIRKDPIQALTLYEQLRIVAKLWGWPDDVAYECAKSYVSGGGHNKPAQTLDELMQHANDAFRTDGE